MQRTQIATAEDAAHIHVRVRRFDPFYVVPRHEVIADAEDAVEEVAAQSYVRLTRRYVTTARTALFITADATGATR